MGTDRCKWVQMADDTTRPPTFTFPHTCFLPVICDPAHASAPMPTLHSPSLTLSHSCIHICLHLHLHTLCPAPCICSHPLPHPLLCHCPCWHASKFFFY